ncbi:DegT/DnrJ/EryC1/StrS family aminotransferase [Moritella sp. 24]|uniref:DegT/DnrJ/EryC1/StrS family aminotransferase n=1 Tax=Moritella sp. 24 TaxID=2746230 RepID=UPI002105B562|nr:DegT/DnrJ/EryC1/StrS family aminotransferase [Moritella sp. 24]
MNNCLDEIQAAMLRVKLKYLDRETKARQNVGKHYFDEIHNSLIKLPYVVNDEGCV